MGRKRKVRIDRILMLLLITVSLIGIFVFAGKKLYSYWMEKVNQEQIVDPTPVKTDDNVVISLESYQTYKDEGNDLGFSFIVARMKFEGENGVSFDLGNLQTSEKILLNNVAKYLNELEEKGYRTAKLELVSNVVSTENIYECNIFIPYKTDNDSIRIMNSKDTTWIEFDLNQNICDVSTLKFETEQSIEVGDASITVSSCSISTMMLHNGEEYQIPSTLNVYTFRINVNSIEENMVIEDARFVREGNDEVIQCLSEEYESVKVGNCLNKKLSLGENGALFFETNSGNQEPDYQGYLMLKFSNRNDWIKIPTTLE
ncbi:MAG: hypothetical protein J5365_08940 [Erysipelotrichaceae bacterium]|nr:hypothetical protein [Erysipelotrichaceae bacterium]